MTSFHRISLVRSILFNIFFVFWNIQFAEQIFIRTYHNKRLPSCHNNYGRSLRVALYDSWPRPWCRCAGALPILDFYFEMWRSCVYVTAWGSDWIRRAVELWQTVFLSDYFIVWKRVPLNRLFSMHVFNGSRVYRVWFSSPAVIESQRWSAHLSISI